MKFDYIKVFTEIIKKNIKKMEEYTSVLNNQSSINVFDDNCMEILSIDDDSIDLVITSPPYGDSRTTVAYGQFSRLSSEWLDLIENENIDKNLLGGLRRKIDVESLASDTLCDVYKKISKLDIKRADEVLSFYYDLDKCLEQISRKTKNEGYQFWVVGNRTVKNVLIPTDKIIIELGKKYNLKLMDCYYRRISNKVMPSLNSPTNKVGELVPTMENETIIFFKKQNCY